MKKQYILFDPRTAERKRITYKELAGITGRSVKSLRDSKRRGCKLKSLNCYILDLDTPISVFKELLAKEVIPDEVWRDIPNSRWQVSSYGRYRRWTEYKGFVYRVPMLKGINESYKVHIRTKDKDMHLSAHEKVVELFIGKVPEGYIVYHKDGNSANNHVDNLGFITKREFAQKRMTPAKRKAVVQIDEVTKEILAEYKSIEVAASENFAHRETIYRAIKKGRSAIGFIWMTEDMALEAGIYE